jgi:hypothetical protein
MKQMQVTGLLTVRNSWRTLAVLLLALLAAPALRAESLEIIELRFRMAEDMLPILEPLVPQGAALTGTGNTLLVRADAATVQQLRDAVATLDRPPRQLLITVGQVTNAKSGGTSVRGSATIGSGDVQVGVNRPPQASTGASATIRSGTASDALRDVASVRALEGRETYIAFGESRPFTSATVSGGGWYPPVVTQGTEYRDVQSGFYATARINGDRVTLEIASRQNRLTDNRSNSAVTTASAATTVIGRLGDWIPVGGTNETSDSTERGIGTLSTRSDLTQYSAWVKVEEIR